MAYPFTVHPSPDEILRASGYLYYNATSKATEAGYGTLMGYTRDGIVFSPGIRTAELSQMETGIYPTLAIFLGAAPRLLVNLLNWNATSMALLFPSLVGGSSGKLLTIPGSLKTGKDLFTAKNVLFVPDDTARHPAIYLSSICSHFIASAKLSFLHSQDSVFPFGCVGKSLQMGLLSEITI